MIGPRNSREDDEYARVVYPGTSVYVNKLDIRDQASLEKIERYLSATRARQGISRPCQLSRLCRLQGHPPPPVPGPL